MFTFRKRYFAVTAILLFVEILIAVFIHDDFIRPYLGDFLVVILMYCFVRSFFWISSRKAAALVLVFACLVEVSQYFHFISYFGWQNSAFARAIFGSSFAWRDIGAYILGVFAAIFFERICPTTTPI